MEGSIGSLITGRPVAVGLDDTLDRVEEVLDRHGLSCVAVVDAQGGCFGVISAPDLVHLHTAGRRPKAVHAWEACTHKVIEVTPDLPVREAAELMVNHQIHHLVVVADRRVEGIVSSIDIVRDYLLQAHD